MKELIVTIQIPIFYDDDGYYLDKNYLDMQPEIADSCETDILEQIEEHEAKNRKLEMMAEDDKIN